IRFPCPHCHRTISAPDHVGGKRAKCPGCEQPIDIPATVVEDGFQVVQNPEVVSDFEVVDNPVKPPARPVAKPAARKPDPDVIEDFEVIEADYRPKANPAARPVARQSNPEVVEDFEVVDESRKAAVKAAGKSPGFSIRAKPARRIDDDIPVLDAVVADEPKPKKRRRNDDDDYEDDDDDDYDDRPRKKRRRRGSKDGTPMGDYGYAICYNCGADAASRVGWTLWGGIIGPAMISHVRCGRCGTTYNGRSGKSNDTAILIYVLVSLGIGLAIVAAVGIAAAAK